MKSLNTTSSIKCNTVRKSFKKLYEQKDLVRNNKDQYGAICDNIWRQSYQRLTPTEQDSQTPRVSSIDFFDLNSNKKVMNSQNQKNIKITYITPYQHNWISLLSDWAGLSLLAKSSTPLNSLELRDSLEFPLVPHMGHGTHSVGQRHASDSTLQATTNILIKNIEIKATRKNTAKMLQHQDTSNLKEGRSVVNIALEKYVKRVKMKTLKES